ncbi:hypothetical protein TNCV_3717421 [Trichonephila clavipes]|nr:hypothetical protein TNCV_3717421 [Trichonephila clavipes]
MISKSGLGKKDDRKSRTIGGMPKGTELTRRGFRAVNRSLGKQPPPRMDPVILNHNQVTRMTPEMASHSPNFNTTPMGGL